jgi:hypothetical protein
LTRAIGERLAFFFVAERRGEVDVECLFFADDFFIDIPRLADAFFADRFADFADADLPLRAFDPPRLLADFLTDFPRDFLARVAMTLLLGVGRELHALQDSSIRSFNTRCISTQHPAATPSSSNRVSRTPPSMRAWDLQRAPRRRSGY